jgi:hypothetical protein
VQTIAATRPPPRLRRWALAGWRADFAALVLLLGLELVVFFPALSLPPTNRDYLHFLSVAARTSSPLDYFVQYQGTSPNPEKAEYRPLNSMLIWLTYRVFDVWLLPDQISKLILHFVNVSIVYLVLRRAGVRPLAALAAAAVALVSLFSFMPVTTTLRENLIVATLVLATLYLLVFRADHLRPLQVVGLGSLALLVKESGLIVPLLVVTLSWLAPARRRFRIVGAALAVVLGYLLLRFYIFGTGMLSYPEEGYLFGLYKYEHPAELPGVYRWLYYLDNVAKNVLVLFVPILTNSGALLTGNALRGQAEVLLPTILLSLYLVLGRKRLSDLQVAALAIILLNALIHHALFRYRDLYLAQLGFALLLGDTLRDQLVWRADHWWTRYRVGVFLGLAAVLVLASAFEIRGRLVGEYWERQALVLNRQALVGVVGEEIAGQISARYGRR